MLLLTELLSSMEELRVSDSLEESDEMKTNLLPGQTGVVTNHLCNCHFSQITVSKELEPQLSNL